MQIPIALPLSPSRHRDGDFFMVHNIYDSFISDNNSSINNRKINKSNLNFYKMRAIWNNQVIAESDKTIIIEDNHYFPHDSIKPEFFKSSDVHSTCPWKGQASYYNIEVNGQINKDAAWYYKEPSALALAKGLKNHVAFWKGIEVTK